MLSLYDILSTWAEQNYPLLWFVKTLVDECWRSARADWENIGISLEGISFLFLQLRDPQMWYCNWRFVLPQHDAVWLAAGLIADTKALYLQLLSNIFLRVYNVWTRVGWTWMIKSIKIKLLILNPNCWSLNSLVLWAYLFISDFYPNFSFLTEQTN